MKFSFERESGGLGPLFLNFLDPLLYLYTFLAGFPCWVSVVAKQDIVAKKFMGVLLGTVLVRL